MRLAERASKWFDWLTGKDNFQMARGIWKLFCAYAAVALIILAVNSRWYAIIGFVNPMVALFTWAAFYRISDIEHKKSAEQQRGAKNLQLDIRLRRDRRFSWSLVVFCPFSLTLTLWWDASYKPFALGQWLIFQPFALAVLVESYLVSIDRPPYAKSKAWEWLKSLLTTPAMPVLVPVPVPSRPSHQTAPFLFPCTSLRLQKLRFIFFYLYA